jgi:hypothetical protein
MPTAVFPDSFYFEMFFSSPAAMLLRMTCALPTAGARTSTRVLEELRASSAVVSGAAWRGAAS